MPGKLGIPLAAIVAALLLATPAAGAEAPQPPAATPEETAKPEGGEATALESRIWTTPSGRRKAEGVFLGLEDDRVRLKTPGGKTTTVPLIGLSRADYVYVKQQVGCPVYLQKTLKDYGIRYSWFFGYASGRAEKYEKTEIVISWADRLALFKVEQRGRRTKVIGAAGSVFVFGLQVRSARLAGPLLGEIERRFGLVPPLRLNLWVDREDNVYVDVREGRERVIDRDEPGEAEMLVPHELPTEESEKYHSSSILLANKAVLGQTEGLLTKEDLASLAALRKGLGPVETPQGRARFLRDLVRAVGEERAMKVGVTFYDGKGRARFVWPEEHRPLR